MEKSPDAFRTISEVSELLDTPAHVLRFWESRFPQVRPVKRAGGRRYYRPTDVALLYGIKKLLHSDGLTIRGVQKVLREHGIRHVMALADGAAGAILADLDQTAAEPAPADVSAPPAPESPKADVLVLGRKKPPTAPVETLPLWSEPTGVASAAESARDDEAGTTEAPSPLGVAARLRALTPAQAAGRQAELSKIAARLQSLRARLVTMARDAGR